MSSALRTARCMKAQPTARATCWSTQNGAHLATTVHSTLSEQNTIARSTSLVSTKDCKCKISWLSPSLPPPTNWNLSLLALRRWFPECTWASWCVWLSWSSQKLVFCSAAKAPTYSSSVTSSSPNTCLRLSLTNQEPSWTATTCSRKSASCMRPTRIALTFDSSASASRVGLPTWPRPALLDLSTKWARLVWL